MSTTAIPVVYLVFTRENNVLLALRKNTGHEDGNWSLPAGHLEAGELPIAAAIREGREEVGIHLSPEDLSMVHTMYREQHDHTGNRADYFVQVYDWLEEPLNAEPDKCGGLQWFSLRALPHNMTPHIRYALTCIGEDKTYSELDEMWLREQGVWQLAE